MSNRNYADSTINMLRIAEDTKKRIFWPKKVAQYNRYAPKLFINIVKAKVFSDWNEHSIDMAALLANTMAQSDELQEAISRDGMLVDGKVHPLQISLERSYRNIVLLRKTIGLDDTTKTNFHRKKHTMNVHDGIAREINTSGDDFNMFAN